MTDPTDTWMREVLRLSYQLALRSPDPSTQNGAMVFDASDRLVGQGCNTFTISPAVAQQLVSEPLTVAAAELFQDQGAALRGDHRSSPSRPRSQFE